MCHSVSGRCCITTLPKHAPERADLFDHFPRTVGGFQISFVAHDVPPSVSEICASRTPTATPMPLVGRGRMALADKVTVCSLFCVPRFCLAFSGGRHLRVCVRSYTYPHKSPPPHFAEPPLP